MGLCSCIGLHYGACVARELAVPVDSEEAFDRCGLTSEEVGPLMRYAEWRGKIRHLWWDKWGGRLFGFHFDRNPLGPSIAFRPVGEKLGNYQRCPKFPFLSFFKRWSGLLFS